MFRRIAIAFFSLTAGLVVAYPVDAQQAPSPGRSRSSSWPRTRCSGPSSAVL